MVANSSNGIAEVLTFKTGTINIVDRQKGRLKADSIIYCELTKKLIKLAIEKLYGHQFKKVLHYEQKPYVKVMQ